MSRNVAGTKYELLLKYAMRFFEHHGSTSIQCHALCVIPWDLMRIGTAAPLMCCIPENTCDGHSYDHLDDQSTSSYANAALPDELPFDVWGMSTCA